MAIALVVGNVIGTGIFYKPGNIASDCGNVWLIIGVWVIGGLLCILGALCFAELATMLPEAGGPYVYLRRAYGKPVAFLFGWTELLLVRPASIGALSVVFVESFTSAINWNLSALNQAWIACALILAMTWVNVIGVVWGGRVQLTTTIIKAGFLALVALSPLLLAPFIGWSIDTKNYSTAVSPSEFSLATQLGAVLLAVMWAYDGWHGVTPLAEEIREPQRNIPLALFGGIGILILLYVAANVAYHGVLSIGEMRAAGDHAAEHMMFKLAGKPGQVAIAMVITFSAFGAINSNLLLAPRVTFAMGRDGVFFRALGQVHATYRTPVISLLTTSLMAIGLVAVVAIGKAATADLSAAGVSWKFGGTVLKSLQNDSIFELLTNFAVFSVSVFYMLSVLAQIVLRIREPDLERPYKTWGYPFVPAGFLVAYAWFLTQVYVDKPLEANTGVVLILLGIPVYFAYRLMSARPSELK